MVTKRDLDLVNRAVLDGGRLEMSPEEYDNLMWCMQNKVEEDDRKVSHPDHYNQINGVECIDVIEQMPFNTGNAMKYLWRYLDKGEPITDLEKAKWYIDREINRLREEF